MGGAGRVCSGICHFFIIGCAICEIVMNYYQLFDVTVWVWSTTWPYGWVPYGVSCAFAGGSTTPCNYLYALGAISLILSIIIIPIGCCARGNVCLMVTELILALCLVGWWLAGAIYFTDAYNDANDGGRTTANDYRHAAMAVAWTAFCFSVVASACSVWSFMVARKAGKEHDGGKHHDAPTAAPVPPQATHGGYAYPPPPDPLAAQYPPAPAPYYPPPGAPPPPSAYPPVPGS